MEFLRVSGSHLPAKQIVAWLTEAIANTDDKNREVLWRERENGSITAQVLSELWDRSLNSLRHDEATYIALLNIVEGLVRAGIAQAAQLRSRILPGT